MNQPSAAPIQPMLPDEEVLLHRSYDQLQTALSIGLVAAWHWDSNTDKVYGDQQLHRLFNLSSAHVDEGVPINTLIDSVHPDDRDRITTALRKAKHLSQIEEIEFRIQPQGTDVKWLLGRGQMSGGQPDHPLAVSGVLIDITDRKQAEYSTQLAESRLKLAIDAAQMGAWDFNPATGELLWSDRCKELFGLPPTAFVDYDVFLRGLHPDDRERTNQIVQHALQPGSSGRYDTEYRTVGLMDQKLRWIRANGQAFFGEDGVAKQFIGTVIDISESKQTEEQLQQRLDIHLRAVDRQTQQLRITLDASLNSIIAMTAIRDDAGHIVDFMMDTANQAVIRSNFMTPEEIIGRPLLQVFPGNKDNGFFDLYVRVVETGQSEQSTQYYRDDLGLEGWFEVSAVRQGENGVVVTFNNITDRKKVELAAQQQAAELKAANAELKRSNESLQQFAHIASHDLQEPLRRIQSFSDLLKTQFADNLSDGETDMIRRIQRAAQRMQMLVKDLLTYSKLSTQREVFSPISLTTVLDDVLSDLEMIVTEKNATIDVGVLPTVSGSSSRLRQLFQNLIANALKFIPARTTPAIRVYCRTASPDELPDSLHDHAAQGFWLITVTDNGIGFDERYKDRIFTPFQRLHDTATYGGTGIGLAICQRVVESHGGAIDVSSQPGQGSTFKVFLPVLTRTN